ncbi:MAG: ABC transporter permease, partial [Pyrinomonadaceae bacterium]|nr:ABC transporter permease [Pyrinomonadaceae bacterium]
MSLLQDIRYGVRMLARKPGFTLIAALTLALGIGANTAIFSVVNTVLLRPLPFANAERFVTVYGGRARGGTGYTPVSYPDFADYKKQVQSFEWVAAYSLAGTTLTSGGDEPERLDGAVVSAELFPMLDAKPALGRVFSAEEDQPGAAPVIVLSYGLWQRRFNSDPKISGQEIKIGGRTATVLGVMPAGFKFPVQADRVDYWSPLSSDPGIAPLLTARGMRFLPVIASLKPNVTLRQAEAEMNTIASRLAAQYPATNTGGSVHLESLHEDLVGDIRPALLVLLGAVGFVLLIACANVANLSLARAAARSKEIAIRTALGASRMRVVRQLLTESLLLSLCGGAVGLMLAVWGVDLLVAASPPDIPRLAEIGIDGRVLLFTLGVSILTGIVFGIAPALQISKHDLNESLKEGDRGSTEGLRRNRVRGLLVVSEVALSLMLLVGAGLLIKSFLHLLETDPGYDTERVLAADIALARTKYPEPDQQAVFFQQAIQRVAALPGVEAVGATNLLPLGGSDTRISFNLEGRPPFPRGETPAARYQIASPDYFRVMNIPLHKGRSFTEQDAKDSPPVVIVSEAFARRFFADEDPIGKRVLIDTVAE